MINNLALSTAGICEGELGLMYGYLPSQKARLFSAAIVDDCAVEVTKEVDVANPNWAPIGPVWVEAKAMAYGGTCCSYSENSVRVLSQFFYGALNCPPERDSDWHDPAIGPDMSSWTYQHGPYTDGCTSGYWGLLRGSVQLNGGGFCCHYSAWVEARTAGSPAGASCNNFVAAPPGFGDTSCYQGEAVKIPRFDMPQHIGSVAAGRTVTFDVGAD